MKFNVDMTPVWDAIIPLIVMAVIGAVICLPLRKFLSKPLFGMLVGLVEVVVFVIWSFTFFRYAFA